MRRTTTLLRPAAWAGAAAALLAASPARALQPLEAFLASAGRHNADALESAANVAETRAQADVALGRVLPGIGVTGSYIHNQFASQLAVPTAGGGQQLVTVTPHDQLLGTAALTVPLVDLANLRRVDAARTSGEAAERRRDATDLQVQAEVAQDYYQLVANVALAASSREALAVSRESLRLAEARVAAGAAATLEVDRARADVEAQAQQVAAADLQVALAERALESASGVAPQLSGGVVALQDDLHPEPDLSAFDAGLETLPSVASVRLDARAAEKDASAQRLALLPTLAGVLTETGTDAPGLTGHDWAFQGVLALTWTFDLTSVANVRARDAAADVARAREARARLAASDAIHRQWSTVAAAIARSRSARAGREAAGHASEQARVRYQSGTTTQLELLQAQRDAFAADVARIQADADVVNARAQLRLASGQPLLAERG
ncbi:MAG: TolC family protein [Anaeromyxobacteraceae bacterium]